MLIAAAMMLASPQAAAPSQPDPGEMIVQLYMEYRDVPLGWSLGFKGIQDGAFVFVMTRDFDLSPDVSDLEPIHEIRDLFCTDPDLKALVDDGTMKVRVEALNKYRGETAIEDEVGELTSCAA